MMLYFDFVLVCLFLCVLRVIDRLLENEISGNWKKRTEGTLIGENDLLQLPTLTVETSLFVSVSIFLVM